MRKIRFRSSFKSVCYIIITVGKVNSHDNFAKCRSSRPQVFYKVGLLKNFAQFTEISVPESFDEVVGRRFQAYYFIKKETLTQVEICKILKNIFLENSYGRLFLDISEY